MAHGTPDFWGAAPKGTTYGLADMAELAVRLGSYVNYDRRGEVIWCDGFDQGGRGYQTTGSGVGSEIYLTCDQADHGGLCLVLKTGAVAGNLTEINKIMRYPILGGLGIEVSFTPVPELADLWLRFYLYDSVHLAVYTADYSHSDGKIYVYDHTLGRTLIGTPGALRDIGQTYSQLKLVIDSLSGAYRRVMINEHTYDASAYSGVVTLDATAKSIGGAVRDICGAIGATEVRLDNMIITQNEPV